MPQSDARRDKAPSRGHAGQIRPDDLPSPRNLLLRRVYNHYRDCIADHSVPIAVTPVAAELGLDAEEVKDAIADLQVQGFLRIEHMHSTLRYVIPGHGHTAWLTSNGRIVRDTRTCMCCSKPFPSEHSGNRLCPSCSGRS